MWSPEIERCVCYVNKITCRNSITIHSNDARAIDVKVMFQDIVAALEGVKVPFIKVTQHQFCEEMKLGHVLTSRYAAST